MNERVILTPWFIYNCTLSFMYSYWVVILDLYRVNCVIFTRSTSLLDSLFHYQQSKFSLFTSILGHKIIVRSSWKVRPFLFDTNCLTESNVLSWVQTPFRKECFLMSVLAIRRCLFELEKHSFINLNVIICSKNRTPLCMYVSFYWYVLNIYYTMT